ncbi:hypothetical protein CCB80_06960 [Armatimonadetes bacterium Uphvl-Ar1]|nr:hypothetical protein CCB80_06960 [Armatimonadetes bacterium Uphvl-Ar1]
MRKFFWMFGALGILLLLFGCETPAIQRDESISQSETQGAEAVGIDLLELSSDTRSGIEQARKELPEFWKAWEGNEWGKGDYIVNVQFMDNDGKGEFLWMSVEARGEGEITGVLEGPPWLEIGHNVGDRLTVKESDVVDWMFLPEEGDFRGGYTLKALGTEPE